MTDSDWLLGQFESSRSDLRKVAYRILGSASEADDAVQEAWLRVSRADASAIENLRGWLTTIVARVCLDTLRARASRREESFGVPNTHAAPEHEKAIDPEPALLLADSIGPALLVVLETLGPAERVAFVLHDMFDLSFDQIASILECSPEAARQLGSRARRRIRGEASSPEGDLARQRELVSAFLAASRGGDLEQLLAVLAPNVRLRADATAVATAAANKWGGKGDLPSEVEGALAVAQTFKGRPLASQLARLDGVPGSVWMVAGQLRIAYVFTFFDEKIESLELVMDAHRLAALDVELEMAAAG